jgi:hypothetical protein
VFISVLLRFSSTGILDLRVPYWAFALWAPFYAFWLVLAIPLEIFRILYLSKKEKE